MPPVALSALLHQIESGELKPVYVLLGDDETGKDLLVERLVDTVEEDLRPFNLLRLSAADVSALEARARITAELLSSARTLPMMAPRRLVILHDAERVLFPKGRSGRKDGDEPEAAPTPSARGRNAVVEEDALEVYLRNPEPMTTMVLVCGAWDDRRRIAKLLDAGSVIVTCGSPETAADAIKWVLRQAQTVGVKMDQVAARTLVDRSGLGITTLRHDFERVMLYAYGEPEVTADHVREVIAPSAASALEWKEMLRAIEGGRTADALREVGRQLDEGQPPLMILGSLRSVAEWLSPSRIPIAMNALFEADLALKTSVGDARTRLEMLVVELCGAKSRR